MIVKRRLSQEAVTWSLEGRAYFQLSISRWRAHHVQIGFLLPGCFLESSIDDFKNPVILVFKLCLELRDQARLC
jgi:hypothetical protein